MDNLVESCLVSPHPLYAGYYLHAHKHIEYTDSTYAKEILDAFDVYAPHFVKILPKDYERMLNAIRDVEAQGFTGEEALMAAFEVNNHDLSRLTGN